MSLIKELQGINDYEQLLEGVIPVHLTLTLEQVVHDGKVTNSVQKFTIANLVCMFKNGGPSRWPRDLNPYGSHAGSDTIEAIESLKEDEQAELAAWLLKALAIPANFEAQPYRSPDAATIDWVRWVTRKTD